ncbi:MAG: YebC/PmpR family DNA-binding transcriptional regulator [Myxococcota bacterium]
MGRMFEKRKATMFKRWDKMAKLFTRIGKEIVMAVKAGGPSPEANPALRRAIQNARAANMPKDKVEGAIKRASGQDAKDYAVLIYEGYGPHGVPILVETATDNPTRTIANIRSHFKKGGGAVGASGSVAFMFDKMGVFTIEADVGDPEELELELIDDGLQDMEASEDDEGNPILILKCEFTDFGTLQNGLEQRNITPKSSAAAYIPQSTVSLSDEQTDEVLALVDRLEQDDDVQQVFHNLD